MNTRNQIIAFFLILLLTAGTWLAVSSLQDEDDNGTDEGYTSLDQESMSLQIEVMPFEEPDENETQGLVFMREEEKLAHDVYLALYERWGTSIFSNIADSEATHTSAVKLLLDRYNITDPFVEETGVFSNETLQQLYDQLVEQGNQSLEAALEVGAVIEEIDIIDIQHFLEDVDNQDIIFVYENLLMGSRNHLRSFVSNLEKRDIDYEPQYLSTELFDSIIGSEMENNSHRK